MSHHYPHLVGTVHDARSGRERISELVYRYPRVSADEAKEILTFLRTGKHLDVGMLTSNDRLRPQLAAFMEDHKKEFGVKWSEAAALVSAIVALLFGLWFVREWVA